MPVTSETLQFQPEVTLLIDAKPKNIRDLKTAMDELEQDVVQTRFWIGTAADRKETERVYPVEGTNIFRGKSGRVYDEAEQFHVSFSTNPDDTLPALLVRRYDQKGIIDPIIVPTASSVATINPLIDQSTMGQNRAAVEAGDYAASHEARVVGSPLMSWTRIVTPYGNMVHDVEAGGQSVLAILHEQVGYDVMELREWREQQYAPYDDFYDF